MDSYTMFGQFSNNIESDFNMQIETIFLNALHRKNYFFVCKEDLGDFVSKYCTCTDDSSLMENTYYVRGIPFLKHNYMPTIEMDYDVETRTMRISGGTYMFI